MQARMIQQEAEALLATYRNQSANLSTQEVSHLAAQAVTNFFDFYHLTSSPSRAAIELLCELNASGDATHASIGLEALFPNLIEKLNDAFFPPYCNLYDRVFTQVISFFRRLPEGRQLDEALTGFGLDNEVALLRRKRSLNPRKCKILPTRPLKKIIFLSRVTIGADIAVTSVIMAHFKQQFPKAELVFIGASKLNQLYGGDPQIFIREISYSRGGNLLSRLETWLQLVAAIKVEIANLHPEQFCIIDPDSRLTQLGLLPLLQKPDECQSYFFYPSRDYNHPQYHKLGQLAAQWSKDIFGNEETLFPFIAIPSKNLDFGRQVLCTLKNMDDRPIVCLSFGVGGNPIKRVSEEFEVGLVLALSQKTKLIIDSGVTPEEQEQVHKLLLELASSGKTFVTLDENSQSTQVINTRTDGLIWRGSIGTFASLMVGSDLYIGYDSAGQHIAAALRIPTLTVFMNSGSHQFPLRWQPSGAGRIKTIFHDPKTDIRQPSLSTLLSEVLNAKEELLVL